MADEPATRRELEQLKELLCTKIEALRELTDTRFKSIGDALELQAAEYERRLENLNHEAQRIQTAQAVSVSRELYDAQQKEQDDKIASLRNTDEKSAGNSRGISSVWAVGATILFLAIALSSLIIAITK